MYINHFRMLNLKLVLCTTHKLFKNLSPKLHSASRFHCAAPVTKRLFQTISAVALCQVHIEPEKQENKFYNAEESLKFACLLNVNAATTLLTTALFSMDRLAKQYKDSLNSLSALLDECILIDGWNDSLWDNVVALRSKANEMNLDITKTRNQLESINKLVTATIETAFNLNADYLCTVLCEQSHSLNEKLEKLDQEIKEAEDNYLLALTAVAKFKIPENKDTTL